MKEYAKALYQAVGWGLVVTVLAIGGCEAAKAGNGVAGITVQVSRNLTSVAVKAIVSGDDDSSAVLQIFQRYETEGVYDSGMVMVKRPSNVSMPGGGGGPNIHEGRILWMRQGRTAYFRIKGTDASGDFTTPWDTVSCAEVRRRPEGGTKYFVNQATGNNANDGLSAGSPKRTFNTTAEGTGALAALLAANTNNSGIIVAPGEYHEKLSISSSTDGYFHYIAGDGTAPESTIICGANLHGEAGRRDVSNNLSWVARPFDATTLPSAHGVFHAYMPTAAVGSSYGDSIGSVTIGWGEFLQRKTSLAALFADSSGTVSGNDLSIGRVGHGYYLFGETLYVKRPGGGSPAGISLHAGYLGPLIDIRRRNWRISKITVRFAGGPMTCSNGAGGTVNCALAGAQVADVDPDDSAYEGIVAGLNANGSGLVVDSCFFYGHTAPGVYARLSGVGLVADSATIANSVFDGLTMGSAGYSASKSRLEENAGGPVVVGYRSNVYNNVITEIPNGIQAGPVTGNSLDSTWASGTEISYNTLTVIADDAIEVDTGHGINELVYMNTIDYVHSGVSVAPIYTGPLFVFYNTFLRFRSAGLKIGNDGNGLTKIYQNTFSSHEPGSRAFEGGSGGYYKAEMVNNIFEAETGIAGMGTDADTANIVATFNYNCVDSAGGRLISRWHLDNTPLNWSIWRTRGFETNGVYGDPGVVGMKRWSRGQSYPLAKLRNSSKFRPSSVTLGAGRRLPGINYGLGGKRYGGEKPNIGAGGCYDCPYQE